LIFPETFITQVNSTFSRYVEEDRSRFRIAAIIIDPGHGGKDPGTQGKHTIGGKALELSEKDITLKIAQQVHASLTAAFPDKRVLLTRNSDVTKSLDERVDLANSVPLTGNESAIYISVHCNASRNKDAKGFEVWYLSPGYRRQILDRAGSTVPKEVLPILNSMLEEELTTESILMARHILTRLEESVGKTTPSRGLKAEEWFVVRNAKMPSVLVELLFLSNEDDFLLMRDDTYLKKLSEALYKGISDFIALFERSGGFTAIQ
jgi:N-acetylmuramoyl-L-alanine amidase